MRRSRDRSMPSRPRRSSRTVAVLLAAAILTLAAAVMEASTAGACPGCRSALDQRTQQSYFIGFVLMTSLPLVTVGGLVAWIAWRSRRLARTHEHGGLGGSSPTQGGRRPSRGMAELRLVHGGRRD
ncbi:MAG: hypothetical protein RMK74_10610 [Myxococcales bacterium]|nr:hypothetical protein [Myxococcales bacterium]